MRRSFVWYTASLLLLPLAGCNSSAPPTMPTPSPTIPSFRSYEKAVLPVLARNVDVFSRATREVMHHTDFATLPSTCESYRQPFDALQIQFDSIPRIGPWYTPSGTLHHRAMGLYHAMVGVVDECQLAGERGDRKAVATLRRDMARILHDIRGLHGEVARSVR